MDGSPVGDSRVTNESGKPESEFTKLPLYADNSRNATHVPCEENPLPKKVVVEDVSARKRATSSRKNVTAESSVSPGNSRSLSVYETTNSAVSDTNLPALDQSIQPNITKIRTPPQIAGTTILDKLLPADDMKNDTPPPSTVGKFSCFRLPI
ncbi:hypothetical protein OESDEN_00074 [Oesophagostomum dentatum]|uniref:Uncharacterized protein n=1 Tax=Oesophagostomum dentatum TaxID=61180 RepID=A0A0B1TRH9_OESDE|nr:hypothetical protein OESDEN_00074 [Oesophagostomum dentatum]